ncbi:MAG TPA: hypothetical protein VLR90_18515 [Blastocatellia bacterium]|nr:hypothetical protein [Blastocatellia bacterium]
MSKGSNEPTIVCRQARKNFSALIESSRVAPIREKLSVTERAATNRHLQTCERCASEYRLFALGRAAMDQAAATEAITPGEDFFKALRARIARGPERAGPERVDESWSAALLLTSRQLIPAMAMLLLIIIGATLVSNIYGSASNKIPTASNQIPRRERIIFNDVYDVPAPTADDVLETLVAVEEKENAK